MYCSPGPDNGRSARVRYQGCLMLMSSIARIAGRTILNRNGVIRNLRNLGLLQLPQRARAHNAYHLEGYYFLMRFYSSPYVIRDIARHLRMDPRMIQHNVVKLGDEYVSLALQTLTACRLKDMTKIPGDYSVPKK
jgi:ribosomal protein S6